jgi:hypothetical protein
MWILRVEYSDVPGRAGSCPVPVGSSSRNRDRKGSRGISEIHTGGMKVFFSARSMSIYLPTGQEDTRIWNRVLNHDYQGYSSIPGMDLFLKSVSSQRIVELTCETVLKSINMRKRVCHEW